MPEARVRFHKCIQNAQDYGTGDEFMISRVFFRLAIEGRDQGDMFVDIKQPVGGDFEADALEVGAPAGTSYRGPFNHEAFRRAAETYYREAVGSKASGIRISPGAAVSMEKNTFVRSYEVTFPVSGPDASW
jgi:hypothetical protein